MHADASNLLTFLTDMQESITDKMCFGEKDTQEHFFWVRQLCNTFYYFHPTN